MKYCPECGTKIHLPGLSLPAAKVMQEGLREIPVVHKVIQESYDQFQERLIDLIIKVVDTERRERL